MAKMKVKLNIELVPDNDMEEKKLQKVKNERLRSFTGKIPTDNKNLDKIEEFIKFLKKNKLE